jgi:XTP/dITP diphosphohydrolase
MAVENWPLGWFFCKLLINMTLTSMVIASGNTGKLREFAALLADLGLEIKPQPTGLEVEETGDTFAEIARLKAAAVAQATGCWALADDSGLSVDALGGAPGVLSARYGSSENDRIARLLWELAALQAGAADRRAQFRAALTVADPSGVIRLEVEGGVRGQHPGNPPGPGWFRLRPGVLRGRGRPELRRDGASAKGSPRPPGPRHCAAGAGA